MIGGIFIAAIPWLPYRNPWMTDLRPIRRALAAGQRVTRSDLFVLRLNQLVTNVVLPVGGVAVAAYGVWRLFTR